MPDTPQLVVSHLDPEETKSASRSTGHLGHPTLPDDRDISWRHSGWHETRRRVYDALVNYGIPAPRLEAFAHCGSQAWVYQSADEPGRLAIMANCCHDRWCTPCQRARARTIKANLTAVAENKRLRLVTLTLKSNDAPLRDQVQRLLKSWRRLKGRKLWKHHCTGGATVLEITWSAQRKQWHPHLHILVEGKFLPAAALRDAWHSITGDSYIVDVRAVKDPAGGLDYICKYVTKPVTHKITLNAALLFECIHALHGVRTVNLFGTWRGTPLTDRSEPGIWVPVGAFNDIYRRFAAGDPVAAAIIHALTGVQTCEPHDNDRPP